MSCVPTFLALAEAEPRASTNLRSYYARQTTHRATFVNRKSLAHSGVFWLQYSNVGEYSSQDSDNREQPLRKQLSLEPKFCLPQSPRESQFSHLLYAAAPVMSTANLRDLARQCYSVEPALLDIHGYGCCHFNGEIIMLRHFAR
jgi:hypothetical protein